MIKILTSEQVRRWDQYTITHEPIASIDLMERASEAFVEVFLKLIPEKRTVRIFCGVGNNGGDGLAIGRILKDKGWEVYKYIVGDPKKGSEDFKKNLDRSDLYAVLKDVNDVPQITTNDVIIDGLFGSGLSRVLGGIYADLVTELNVSEAARISIDIASGLFSDGGPVQGQVIFQPDHTISFQVPKLPFFLPELHPYVGNWEVVDIGLNPSFLQKEKTENYFTEAKDLAEFIPRRGKFVHKSEVGKLMIVAGSKGKMGAAVLCTNAAFAAGASLINVCTPRCGTDIMQLSVPEAMVIEDSNEEWVAGIPKATETVAVGPGLGTASETAVALERMLKKTEHPIVLDADALNILSKKKALLKLLPKNSILTPHPGEFRRLVGPWKNDFEKLSKLRKFSKKYQVQVVLKGAYSAVCDSEGTIYINPSGNPALATAGSGDVLTGIVGAFLAQNVPSLQALRLGVYVHGLAGDLAISDRKWYALRASELIGYVSDAIVKTSDF